MLRTLCASASLGGVYFWKTGIIQPPHKIMLQAQEIKYMAAPLSDLSGVTSNSAMRKRMEKFIVSLQVLTLGKALLHLSSIYDSLGRNLQSFGRRRGF